MRRRRRASPGTRRRRSRPGAPRRCFELGRLTAREGSDLESAHPPGSRLISRSHLEAGLRLVRQALAESPRMIRAGGMEVALLRRTGRIEEAKAGLAALAVGGPAQLLPPPRGRSPRLRATRHCGRTWPGTPSASSRSRSTTWRSACGTTRTRCWPGRYPSAGVVAEPGMVLPQDYPLVAYYRGYCGEKLGLSGREDFALASRQSTRYVFPNRPESLVVLRRALEVEPRRRVGSLPARVAHPLRRGGRPGPRRVGEGARARPATARPPPQHRLHAPLRARRGRGRPARVRGGHECGPDERRALPGRRPGPEPPRPRGRGEDRPRCAAIPRRRCLRRSSSSWRSRSPRRAASPRRSRCSRGASSRARSSGRTCGRSTWK